MKLKKIFLGFVSLIAIYGIVYTCSLNVRLYSKALWSYVVSEPDLSSIEKIYIINLDGKTERLNKTLAEAKRLNIPAEVIRFPAINGKKIKLTRDNEVLTLGEDFPPKKPVRGRYSVEYNGALKDLEILFSEGGLDGTAQRFIGEVGCCCSHREVWNDIIEKGYKKVLVLEDDVRFRKFSDMFLSLSMKNIPENWDFLYLKASPMREDSLDRSHRDQFYDKVLRDVLQTESYIITDRGAKRLLEETKLYTKGLDYKLGDVFLGNKDIVVYSVFPRLSKQQGPSIIANKTM